MHFSDDLVTFSPSLLKRETGEVYGNFTENQIDSLYISSLLQHHLRKNTDSKSVSQVPFQSLMTTAGLQGRTLKISVIGWRDTTANTHSHHTHGHHLYAVVRYGDKSCTTGTCKGGTGTAPFNDELTFQFIEDRHEFDVAVWRKSRLGKIGKDKLIAFGKIRLDDQVLGGRPSRRTWHLHHPPEYAWSRYKCR
ncbi:uncharacterized protein LOC116248336 isoform X2 [Nymphaea colorata]|uniref:uncharacterized protein LOC116248336 isoform X2 n=1 Tax=Nymphaea colorata TaxID=210225 RepID=UPI00129E0058|nr:uncharacterized protein LOC116248336 isoform X2 [Nymphaea colorata]